MKDPRDRALGMGRAIDRRDFLNGVALAAGASLLSPREILGLDAAASYAPEKASTYYPPALTGLRGSTDGTFEAAHALKDGAFKMTAPIGTGESYDLVVVGAGISGLAAAHFYREAAGAGARVLLLDNHDDFGGHARRNEFKAGDRLIVSYGGTQSIDSPGVYSAVAKGLVSDLGIDVSRWRSVLDEDAYKGLDSATFFDRETFGQDKLVKNLGRRRDQDFDDPARTAAFQEAPLTEAVRRDIRRLETEAFDPWPGLPSAEKKARLLRMSYASFLTDLWKLDLGVLPFYQARPHGLFGVGIDAMSALDGWGLGLPGFSGLKLEKGYIQGMNRDAMRAEEAGRYYFHFPDGNATLARLLVQRLIPGVLAGATADDVVSARADYGRLDEPASAVRLRLNSTVVQVRHVGDRATAKEVEVAYVRGGTLQRVAAKRVVMACWNVMIPHLCRDLPPEQREALSFAVKVPLVYTNVLVRNWTAFQKLGIRNVSSPGGYWRGFALDFPLHLRGYASPRNPDEPIVVHLSRTPCAPGHPIRDQHRIGRMELLNTSFAEMERQTREVMARALGAGGFDPARDVLAMTVNRWPHGYAYQYNALFDPFWLEGTEPPCVRARRPFGRIFIANSDADAYAYTDGAIDQAHRAVREMLGRHGVSDAPGTADERLARFGYRPELRRTLGLFASFGIAFSYVSPVVGVYTLFGYGLATGGPAFLWSLPLVVGGQLLVVLVFSEVAASFPLAGALYQWGRRLVGPRYGFFVGWIYGWALVVTIAAVDFGAAPYLASLLGLSGDRGTLVFLALGLLLLHSAFNAMGVKATSAVTSFGVAVEVIATVVIAGALVATGLHQKIDVLFTTAPAPLPYLPAFLASSLAMAWIFYGFESAADVAEEVVHPGRHVPRAMILSLLGAALVTFVVEVALILGARDLRAAAADPGATIPLILGDHFGPGGRAFVVALVVFAYFSCAAAAQAAAARLIFSYARDGMLPASPWLCAVNAQGVPAHAIAFTAVAGVLVTSGTFIEVRGVNANALLVAYAVAGIYLSFQAVVAGRLLAAARGWRPDGEFQLGRASVAVAVAALGYGLAMLVNLCWPRPADEVAGWLPLASAVAIVVPGAVLATARRPR